MARKLLTFTCLELFLFLVTALRCIGVVSVLTILEEGGEKSSANGDSMVEKS